MWFPYLPCIMTTPHPSKMIYVWFNTIELLALLAEHINKAMTVTSGSNDKQRWHRPPVRYTVLPVDYAAVHRWGANSARHSSTQPRPRWRLNGTGPACSGSGLPDEWGRSRWSPWPIGQGQRLGSCHSSCALWNHIRAWIISIRLMAKFSCVWSDSHLI